MRGHLISRVTCLLLWVGALSPAMAEARTPKSEEPTNSEDYQREELGVNQFTAPSIAQIFHQLDELRPLPYEQLKRDFPQATHLSRENLGLIFGGLIADGFLIVECKKQNLVEDFGRALLRQARSLGVGDRVIRHSSSLTDHGKRGDWPAVRRELVSTQNDVQQSMIALRDQRMAHLISLGGWLRGLEIASAAVDANFSAERVAILWQRDLTDYFAEEVKTFPPSVTHTPLFEKLRLGVEAIRDLVAGTPSGQVTSKEVNSLQTRAQELNLVILAGG
jgi:hypothetical protein